MNARDLERLLDRERRKNGRDSPREHRLARTRTSNHEHIVPAGNGNLKRSSAALNNLSVFQELGFGADTSLFKTEVMLAHPFPWSPTEHDKKLDDILTYQSLSGTPIGNLYETLYTRAERNTFLNEGFRGRPSIGAAVLARKAALFETQGWEDHADAPWDKFARLVKQDAKNGQVAHIFLAGSVFGGTGAAGMPTIAKLLRREFASYCESGTVAIGGALILPFFGFTPQQENGDGQIYASSENFLTNTKAALEAYNKLDFKNMPFDEWLELEYKEPREQTCGLRS